VNSLPFALISLPATPGIARPTAASTSIDITSGSPSLCLC